MEESGLAKEDWLKTLLRLPNGIPFSRSTRKAAEIRCARPGDGAALSCLFKRSVE